MMSESTAVILVVAGIMLMNFLGICAVINHYYNKLYVQLISYRVNSVEALSPPPVESLSDRLRPFLTADPYEPYRPEDYAASSKFYRREPADESDLAPEARSE
jgi:hypothetical protein